MKVRVAPIHALFFLSGASGLVYQVLWVRAFGNVFGNTVRSAALVTSVFMGGLGVGGFLAGGFADRRRRAPAKLVRAYGTAEILIGLGALALAVALPRLGTGSALAFAYARRSDGFLAPATSGALLRYLVAAATIAPITCLMGATLTLLVRFVVASDLGRAGPRIGALYGINTAGAALGCLLTDGLLVPRFGLFATQAIAVATNFAVGLAALAFARAPTTPQSIAPVEEPAPTGDARLAPIALAIFLTGFAAMGIEIVWFRILSVALGEYRAVFSLLLAVILVGMWLGATAGGALVRRLGRPVELYLLQQGLLVATTLALLLAFDPAMTSRWLHGAARSLPPGAGLGPATQVLGLLRSIAFVALAPAFLMGFAYPLANAEVQRIEAGVGRRAGLLYLANTAGAVLGALAAGFALLPRLGAQGSVTALAAVAGASLLPLALAGGRARSRGALATAISLVAVSLGGWAALPRDALLQRQLHAAHDDERFLTAREGENEIVAVTEDAAGSRTLYTNGHRMSGTGAAAERYMRAMAHLPLLAEERPRDVLVICFGVGNTLSAASLHPSVERLEVADLSANVLEHAGWFARTNGDVLRDPRVTVFLDDGRHRLRAAAPASYDLVTLEPPPITAAGVASLYSTEFYRLVAERLRDSGFVTQWLPAYQAPAEVTLAMVRAFVDVFPQAALFSGDRAELILVGTRAPPLALDPAAIAARLAARPRVAADLARIRMGTLTELLGAFVADGATLREATRDVAPITDDRPLMEYAAIAKTARPTRIPTSLLHPERLFAVCPRCAADPRLAALPDYLDVLARFYRSDDFQLRFDWGESGPRLRPGYLRDDPRSHPTIAASAYLRSLLPRP